ncbi:MAG: hypothetical protein KUG78_13105 [Kangiellaceae bacterium]|nr:hypothetical protein [Kangiellaceae bacterium]
MKGGDIKSYIAKAIVGDLDGFIFVDSFPNMDFWVAKNAAIKTKAGKKINDSFDKVSECKSNSLYSVEES